MLFVSFVVNILKTDSHHLLPSTCTMIRILSPALLLFLSFPSTVIAGEPACTRPAEARYQLGGVVGDYIRRVSERWLKPLPDANPAILDMFRDRERRPLRQMEPWAGEFAGKYLTGATQVYRLTGDAQLRAVLDAFVADLVALQAKDGYLGPWPEANRLTGFAPNTGKSGGGTWDAWGHYHVMLGLLLWYETAGDTRALDCAKRIGDLLCNKFLDSKTRLVDTGSTEMNLAPVHALCLLYRQSHDPRHLALARKIADEFAAVGKDGKPLAGDYLNAALAGKEFFATPKPRWESLHPILGLAELFYLTGDDRYRKAFEHWWWSIVKLDRHNNGGFSSGEQAQGNPYHRGAIETCCTIAWLAMGVEMLRLTENSVVADELELSTLNSVVGMHSPSGRWCTYNTPMDGVRKASAHDIVFQSREGSPELNCCSVNSARGFGMISDWALLRDREGLVLNWYGPATFETKLASGVPIKIVEETTYPRDGNIRLRIDPGAESAYTLKLRIPYWSANTRYRVNAEDWQQAEAGRYLSLARTWKPGDTIELTLDFSLHYWLGEKECKDRVSIYRGPILLAYDRRFNAIDPPDLPVLDARGLKGRVVDWPGQHKPFLLLEFNTMDGRKLHLCDFGSAGDGGSPYISWLRVQNVPRVEFTRDNPLRSGRAPKF